MQVSPDPSHQFARLVFPFGLLEVASDAEVTAAWNGFVAAGWQLAPEAEALHLLPHVSALLRGQRVRPGGADLIRLRAGGGVFEASLGTRFSHLSVAGRDGARYRLCLNGVELFAFLTGVGVLVVDVTLEEVEAAGVRRAPQLADLVDACYRLRQQRTGDLRARIDLAPGREGEGAVAIHVSNLLRQLLAPLGDRVDLTGEGRGGDAPAWCSLSDGQLLVYSYLFVDRRADGDEPDLYRLRHGIGPDYDPPLQAEKPYPGMADEEFATFDNICFGITLSGGYCVVTDNGSDFLRHEFGDRVRANYFLLFLLALHQRSAALLLATWVDRRLDLGTSWGTPVDVSVVRSLRAASFYLTVHCRYVVVSNLTAYARVYERWLAAFSVEALYREVDEEIRQLDEYLHRIEADQRAGREMDRNWALAIIAGVLAIPSTVFTVLAVWERDGTPGLGTTAVLAWAGVSVLFGSLVALRLAPERQRSGRLATWFRWRELPGRLGRDRPRTLPPA